LDRLSMDNGSGAYHLKPLTPGHQAANGKMINDEAQTSN
jgi:hypothetical protein